MVCLKNNPCFLDNTTSSPLNQSALKSQYT